MQVVGSRGRKSLLKRALSLHANASTGFQNSSMSSVSISHHFRRNGVLNIPRASPGSKSLAETLLWKDAQKYHCHFNQAGFHNHLSHQCVLLSKIYEMTNQSPLNFVASQRLMTSEQPLVSFKRFMTRKLVINVLLFWKRRIRILQLRRIIGASIWEMTSMRKHIYPVPRY